MSLEETAELLEDTISLQSGRCSPTLEITVSGGCNKSCSYCFEHAKPSARDLEEEHRQLEIVKRLCREFDHKKFGRLHLSFWGGEPLVNTEWLREILLSTTSYEFVDYSMFTNGTLHHKLRELIEDEVTRHAFRCGRFQVQVSYDGEPHHSLKRGYSFDEAEPMLDLLQASSIPFTLKATVAEDSIEMMPECWKSYEHLYCRYGKQVSYSPAIDTSSDLSGIDFQTWSRVVRDLAKLELGFIKKHKHPLMSWFRRDQKRICDVRNSIHMHTDGNLYICHGAPYLDESKRSKFAVTTTRDLLEADDIQSILFRDDSIDTSCYPRECLECDATFCGMCHVSVVDPDNCKKDWAKCICQQKKRCQLYQEFGKTARALLFASLINGKY